MLGPFTQEIHNIMLSTSTGSFLFGVVMMLKVTLSTALALRSKTISYPLTDGCPVALDMKTADAQLHISKSCLAHRNLRLQFHSNSIWVLLFFPGKLTLHT